MGVKIPITDGPPKKVSLGAFYMGREMPEVFHKILEKRFECPKSKNGFFHNDRYQLFLVPVK